MSKYHKPAGDCPVCGGMMDKACEVCGNGRGTREARGMRIIMQPKSKEDVTEGLITLIKTMERDAKVMPEIVEISVKPSEEFKFGVEFRIEWE